MAFLQRAILYKKKKKSFLKSNVPPEDVVRAKIWRCKIQKCNWFWSNCLGKRWKTHPVSEFRIKKMTPWSIFEDPLLENQMSYQLLIKTISIWNSFAPRVRRLLLVSGKTLLAGLERAKNLNFWVSDDVINSYFRLQQPDLKDSKVPPFAKILWKFQKIYSRFNSIQDEGGGQKGPLPVFPL